MMFCTRLSIVVAALAGCATNTPIAVTDHPEAITADRDVVLSCTVVAAASRPNLNFAEDHFGPMPSRVAGGSVTDVSLRVDSVVKGSFDQATIHLKDAQTPSQREPILSRATPDAINYRERLIVGFNRGLLGARRCYIIARDRSRDS